MNEPTTLPYRLIRGLFRLLFHLFTHVDAQGLERTPMEGPLLIAANHTTLFEGPLILAVLPRQPISAMAKQEYRDSPLRYILRAVDPVYVSRGEVDRAALKEMLRRLKAGKALGIAPEGTRSHSGNLIEGKEGAAYLALQTGAWILPIAVWGQERLVSELKRGRRATIHLRAGEPFKLAGDPNRTRAENVAAGTERIMHAIARLLPPERRGAYAEAVQGPPEWQERLHA